MKIAIFILGFLLAVALIKILLQSNRIEQQENYINKYRHLWSEE